MIGYSLIGTGTPKGHNFSLLAPFNRVSLFMGERNGRKWMGGNDWLARESMGEMRHHTSLKCAHVCV